LFAWATRDSHHNGKFAARNVNTALSPAADLAIGMFKRAAALDHGGHSAGAATISGAHRVSLHVGQRGSQVGPFQWAGIESDVMRAIGDYDARSTRQLPVECADGV